MSTQQDIYVSGSETCPPMLNKENYVPWSSRLPRYDKSRPNGKLIYNSIMNGPYVIRMNPEPEIYAAVDNCETAQEIWLRVQQMMKGSDIGIQEKKDKLFNKWERQISQPGMNMGQDRQMQMVGGNGRNQFRQYAGQNVGNQNGYNTVQNFKNPVVQNAVQNPESKWEWDWVPTTTPHLARNYTVRPRRRDATYLQTQLLIAQKEEAGIQLQAEEFDLMAAARDLDKIKEVNPSYILMVNFQQASTSGTQTDNAPVYDSDGSAEVQHYDNCYNNDIFNMFTQEEYVEQRGGTVEQYPSTVEETRAYFELLYNNLEIEVEKVNTVNRKLRETNDD
ncbi:hypothetical protein Tco_0816327 [Tanacetum coccineum]